MLEYLINFFATYLKWEKEDFKKNFFAHCYDFFFLIVFAIWCGWWFADTWHEFAYYNSEVCVYTFKYYLTQTLRAFVSGRLKELSSHNFLDFIEKTFPHRRILTKAAQTEFDQYIKFMTKLFFSCNNRVDLWQFLKALKTVSPTFDYYYLNMRKFYISKVPLRFKF